jgi:hypothetical protein
MEMTAIVRQHGAMFGWPPRQLLVVAVFIGAVFSGCRTQQAPLTRQQCDCEMLTDTDQISGVRVEVCAAEALIETSARACAQSGAPANVQACRCRPAASQDCVGRSCKVYPTR